MHICTVKICKNGFVEFNWFTGTDLLALEMWHVSYYQTVSRLQSDGMCWRSHTNTDKKLLATDNLLRKTFVQLTNASEMHCWCAEIGQHSMFIC